VVVSTYRSIRRKRHQNIRGCKKIIKARISFQAPVVVLIAIFLSGTQYAVAFEDGYGSLTGQFILDGKVPNRKLLVKKGDTTVKDASCCAAQEVPSDELVIDEKTKGIQHIFIYKRKAKTVHPKWKLSKIKELVFDQKGCRFRPHTLVVRTDQQVVVQSDDPIGHNTHTYPINPLNPAMNFVLNPSDRVGVKVHYEASEILPTMIKCDIHPWMKAYWLIVDHPYAAVTDTQGKFTIKDLPTGEHKFRVWHERVGYIERKFKVTVTSGETTKLQPIKVPVARFEED